MDSIRVHVQCSTRIHVTSMHALLTLVANVCLDDLWTSALVELWCFTLAHQLLLQMMGTDRFWTDVHWNHINN